MCGVYDSDKGKDVGKSKDVFLFCEGDEFGFTVVFVLCIYFFFGFCIESDVGYRE